MFSYFFDNHLIMIKQLLINKPKCILVYKGFPAIFLLTVTKYYNFFSSDILTQDNLFDLSLIIRNLPKTIQSLLDPGISGVFIMPYEQFLYLNQKIDLQLSNFKFIIIENNFLKFYPNQTTEHVIDVESEIDKNNLSLSENNLLSDIVSMSEILNGIEIIEYKNVDLEDNDWVLRQDYFLFNELTSESQILFDFATEEKLKSFDFHIYYPTSPALEILKYNLFLGRLDCKSVAFVIDKRFKKGHQEIKELLILKFALEKMRIRIGFFQKDYSDSKYRKEIDDILMKYWKSPKFRELAFYRNPDLEREKTIISQGAIINDVIEQVERAQGGNDFNDVFLTSPTGSGKSVLFQIPAKYIFDKFGLLTVVISPLKALMYDQVSALKRRGISEAEYLNSDVSLLEKQNIIERIMSGEVSLLYLSPELLLSYDIKTFVGERKVGLVVVDEAHLVTTWGRDFRIDYWYLGNHLRKIRKSFLQNNKYSFPIFAVTATAVYGGEGDTVFSTIETLSMQTPRLYIGNVVRDNIDFQIEMFEPKENHEMQKIEKTFSRLFNNLICDIKTIAYFPWTNQVRQLYAKFVSKRYASKIGMYFADVFREEKQLVMDSFLKGDVKIVLATKAFGMGVDVDDIAMIYHHAPSGSLSDYVQEIGRVARKVGMQGVAKVDFGEKDLKFTKILYGLSSLKLYELKYLLTKVLDLYTNKKQRNILASIDDFAYIFPPTSDLAQKVKSGLLLLEKDLLRKFGYNIFIVRPKSLFGTVFAVVPYHLEESFKRKYGPYLKIAFWEKKSSEVINSKGINSSIIVKPLGNVYEIRLDELWERFFPDQSFPALKYKFYKGKIWGDEFTSIYPRLKMDIILRYNPRRVFELFDNYINVVESVLMDMGGAFFSRDELEEELSSRLKSRSMAMRISSLILNIFVSSRSINSSQFENPDEFIQARKSDDRESVEYRVIVNRFPALKSKIVKEFWQLFTQGEQSQQRVERFVPVGEKIVMPICLMLAYVLESFNLATYEIRGGNSPQIFMRINDPYRIKLLLERDAYQNDILEDIDKRQKQSVSIMEIFFSSKMSQDQRWKFIEDYFLGSLQI